MDKQVVLNDLVAGLDYAQLVLIAWLKLDSIYKSYNQRMREAQEQGIEFTVEEQQLLAAKNKALRASIDQLMATLPE